MTLVKKAALLSATLLLSATAAAIALYLASGSAERKPTPYVKCR